MLKHIFSRRRRYDDLSESIREHLEEKIADLMDRGMTRERAEHAARREFGNVTRIEERSREVWQWQTLEETSRDINHAIRHILKSPAFTFTAVLTLALGIGATTAIFSLIQQVMLRSLPVAKPQQLWRIGDGTDCCHSNGYAQNNEKAQNDWSLFSWRAYQLFRANTPAFEHLAAFELGEQNAELAVRHSGSPTPVKSRNGEYASGNFFRTFGISAWRGRLFTDADDRDGAPPVAVMSFHTWQQKYGSDPSVVGASFEINGHAFTVIGITPPGFYGAKVAVWGMPDFWLPLAKEPMMAGASSRLKNPASAWLALIGRVRPGTNVETLQAQLRAELQEWLANHAADMNWREKGLWREQTLNLTPGGGGVSLMAGEYRSGLLLLFLAASCVLLLACANLANLLLARGLRNRQQTAVHMALGSSRGRLLRKALAESVVLAIMGGVAGTGVAWAAVRLILHLAYTHSASSSWIPVQASLSLPVLFFALGISVATGIAFGGAPAAITSRTEPIEAMRGSNRTTGGSRHWVQKTLVVVQVTISMVLLSAAAMLGQSLRNHEQQSLGFNSTGRYLVSIDPEASGIPEARLVQMFQKIDARLRAIPGVRSVGAVQEAPPGGWMTHEIRIEGQPEPGPRANFSSGWTRVMPGFFATYGDKIVMGRALNDEDNGATEPVAVVNQAFASKFFGEQNPLGQHFGPAPEPNAGMYDIVGVAANVAFQGGLNEPMYFLPEAQTTLFGDTNTESEEVWSHYLYSIAIWAPGDPSDLEAEVKNALGDIDPDLIMYGMSSYEEMIHDNFAQQNMIASLTWLFGAIGLVLSAVGLYGVTAYGVEQRTSEIGLRMALGADHGAVVAMVLRGAFGQVALGLALGLPAAIGAGHLMASQLFGVQPWNPALLALAALLLGSVALVAAWSPARRAAAIDPMQSLRSE